VIESSTFKQFNLTFVNIVSILKQIEINLINDLTLYNLLSQKRITRDIKKLIYHHVFHGLCEYILNTKHQGKLVFLIKQSNPYHDIQLHKFFKCEDIDKHLDQAVKQVAKLLPMPIHSHTFNFSIRELNSKYDQGIGEVREFVELIKSFQASYDFIKTYYTFAKVRAFAKRNELTFLNEKYFNQLKTRQLLMI
jgi:hypothetical protein